MAPVAVMVSNLLFGSDGVAFESRKWEVGLHKLGCCVRRVSRELDI